MVICFALITAVTAQIRLPLPWTPVPVTAQTFAVLLSGATLGWRAGAGSQLLYLSLGAVGLPFFSGGKSGFAVIAGPTGGYLIGFVIAAALVGFLAELGQDRRVSTSILTMLAGSTVIYLVGISWLAHVLNISAVRAVELGMAPFLIGDALKLLVAGVLLPGAWSLVGRQ
ncbi:MAG TPA: biotin transporter BioY [Aeromicrobium sp.]|nr:biotin transporter BioY [Aeromicrobium sp.]